MNIDGVFVNLDVLSLILIKLPYQDYGRCLQTCKIINQCSRIRSIYLNKKLACGRQIIRFEYGPIYLAKKYNDLEFLQYYIHHKHPIEPDKIVCLDNKIIYKFLIRNYSNNIEGIDLHVISLGDEEDKAKFVKPI